MRAHDRREQKMTKFQQRMAPLLGEVHGHDGDDDDNNLMHCAPLHSHQTKRFCARSRSQRNASSSIHIVSHRSVVSRHLTKKYAPSSNQPIRSHHIHSSEILDHAQIPRLPRCCRHLPNGCRRISAFQAFRKPNMFQRTSFLQHQNGMLGRLQRW